MNFIKWAGGQGPYRENSVKIKITLKPEEVRQALQYWLCEELETEEENTQISIPSSVDNYMINGEPLKASEVSIEWEE